MLRRSSTIHQPNLFGTDLLMQLDVNDPLLKLAGAIEFVPTKVPNATWMFWH